MMPMRSGLYLPIFDELADPAIIARLSAEAEEAGWHGVFVWDHVLWRQPVLAVADPWITLAAIATATERVRVGPMVTPLARNDIVAALPPGSDPASYAAAGATWWLVEFPAEATTAELVRAVVRDGPAVPS